MSKDHSSILNQLQEELSRLQKQLNTRKTRKYQFDFSKLQKLQDQITMFNDSYFYKPAEVAIEENLKGISLANAGNMDSAIHHFKSSIQNFAHPTIISNLATCYKRQSQYRALEELDNVYHILESDEYKLANGSFLNPTYIAVDKKEHDESSEQLQGYNYVFEKLYADKQNNSESSHFIFNVPYVIWREFYTIFFNTIKTTDIHMQPLIDKGELLLYEVSNKPYIQQQPDPEEILFLPIAEVEIPVQDKDNILNIYKNFIIEFYLKMYISAYISEEWAKRDPGIDFYFQEYGEIEKAYGFLKSAIYNCQNNVDDPFVNVNDEEFYKGVSEYRSYFPEFFPDISILLDYLEKTFETTFLEKIKNASYKEDIRKVFLNSISVIKSNPNSIFVHIRKSLEITLRYILENDENIPDQITLHEMIKRVMKKIVNKKFILEPILDTVNSEQSEYFTKTKIRSTFHSLKNDANRRIHYDWNDKDLSMEEINSERAFQLFEKNIALVRILIDEFKL